MGDRANIKFTFGPDHGPIYLYTHWHGSELPLMLQDALKEGKPRWGDDSYLARICVSRIVGMAGDHQSETGWGISPYMVDNEYAVTECNLIDSTVTINAETWPFQVYVTLAPAVIKRAYVGEGDEESEEANT